MCGGTGWVYDGGIFGPLVGASIFMAVCASLYFLNGGSVDKLRPKEWLLLTALPFVALLWLFYFYQFAVAAVRGQLRVRCSECRGGNGEPK